MHDLNEPLDTYSASAKYYDDVYCDPSLVDDLPFWLELAQRSQGPALEVACGTGRVLLPIARCGIPIDGLDRSEALLSMLRSKLAGEPAEVRDRVRLHVGDMRDFDLGKKYGLVTIPFRPLQHMYSIEDQIAALAAAKRHLAPGGRLAFNVFYPDLRLLDANFGVEVLEREWTSTSGQMVRRYLFTHTIDRLHQWFEAEYIFRTYAGEAVILEERAPLRMCWFTYPHLQLLFRIVGLQVVEEYGSFRKEPIQVCKEMIFLLRGM